MDKQLGRLIRARSSMSLPRTRFDQSSFWETIFDAALRKGSSIRVGSMQCAEINCEWVVMADGAETPFPLQHETRQDAVDWMVTKANDKCTDSKNCKCPHSRLRLEN